MHMTLLLPKKRRITAVKNQQLKLWLSILSGLRGHVDHRCIALLYHIPFWNAFNFENTFIKTNVKAAQVCAALLLSQKNIPVHSYYKYKK